MDSFDFNRLTLNPDAPYPMTRENLGHAVILNNISEEFSGSMKDVEALKSSYEKVGFTVRVENGLNQLNMLKLKQWLTLEETHVNSNCVMVTVLSHGNERGWLLAVDKKKGWVLEDLVLELSDVDSLRGKPKLFIIQACRGSAWKTASHRMEAALAEEEESSERYNPPHPDKTDIFIGFATVPGYKAFAGDENGSFYLQCLARAMRELHESKSFEDIHLIVKRLMAQEEHGKQKLKLAAEERSSLLYKLKFAEFLNRTGPTPVGATTSTAYSKIAPTIKYTIKRSHNFECGLYSSEISRFNLTRKGQPIVYGTAIECPVIEKYNRDTGKLQSCIPANYCFHMRPKSDFKVHPILHMSIQWVDYIAISCGSDSCGKIWLLPEDSYSPAIEAFDKIDGLGPGVMCHGPTNSIIASSQSSSDKQAIIIDSSTTIFRVKGRVQIGIALPYDMTFDPESGVLVTSRWDKNILAGSSLQTKELIWTIKNTLAGEKFYPANICVDSRSHVFVTDSHNRQIHILDALNGSLKQTINIRKETLGGITGVGWSPFEPQLAICHAWQGTLSNVAYYKVTYETT